MTGIQIIKLEKGGWFTKPHVVAKASAELLSSGGRTKEYEAVSLMRSIDHAVTVAIVTCARVRRIESVFYSSTGATGSLESCVPRVIKANDVLSALNINIEAEQSRVSRSATRPGAMRLLNEGLPALLAGRRVPKGASLSVISTPYARPHH